MNESSFPADRGRRTSCLEIDVEVRLSCFPHAHVLVRVRPVSPRAEAALASEEAMAECVTAGRVTMEIVQSIELGRGHCRVRDGVEGACEAAEDEESRWSCSKSRRSRVVEEVDVEVGASVPHGRRCRPPLEISRSWERLHAGARFFFSRQQGWVRFFSVSFLWYATKEGIAFGRQVHSDLQFL